MTIFLSLFHVPVTLFTHAHISHHLARPLSAIHSLVYTIAYGAPEVKDPRENVKIFMTTMALIGVGIGLFALARSFGTI